ncbi:uncharacterized protein LOC135074867 [Ostrinia nubilalis]|uniref:uncharacterized protein LOC135074867 n=1 Tax=Ostrinia nubilalis TaxID=29057 RepID=UPI003082309C
MVNVSKEALPSLMHLHLADPNFNVSKDIDMILGVSCFAKCLREGKIDLGPNMPTLINTEFGWEKRCEQSYLDSVSRDEEGRQIRVKPQYQALQRILWRDDPSHDIQCLQLDTVTYGTASASYLATRTLVKLVEDEVPRLMVNTDAERVELHGFADSSTKAYGCVVYIRCSCPEKTTVHLVCAKTRVAPLKPVTLPKLELCAALLLAKLMSTVSKTLNISSENSFYWTDSMITLCWIQSDPARRDVFVSNRVGQIQNLSPKDNWFHVKSSENPADMASRGLEPQDLSNCKLWFNGPNWLFQSDSPWLHSPQVFSQDDSVGVDTCNDMPSVALPTFEETKNDFLELFERYSSWSRLVRVMAYVRRFINNMKNAKSKITEFLTSKELNQASSCIIKCVQHAHFQKNANGNVSSELGSGSKSLKFLNIFSDGEGMLRVGGRLRYADIPVDQKFPLLLPARCHVTDLLIRYEHERLLHAGTQTTLSSLRRFVWPLNARNSVRHFIHKCVRCYRFKA